MEFLVDEDVYGLTCRFLEDEGHNLTFPGNLGLSEAADVRLLREARDRDLPFLTRDKDFGALVFLREDLATGVVLLRLSPSTIEVVHRHLVELLNEESERSLRQKFCTVDVKGYRVRQLPTE